MDDVKKLIEEMFNDLQQKYPELVEKEKAQVVQILTNWAEARIELLNCSDSNKAVAEEIVTSCKYSVNNLICAIQAKSTNLVTEKVQSILKYILDRYVLGIIV